ncbi:cytoplasmic dynein 2 intermediate chain 1 isoform X4 [Clupea harengus]|uniref:Cytoplasmic dynein 2 intermediate chain 1 isoform X3 n=1 Tax=Clupea harengus TaxID=7950 RepID=A0A8M1KX91_CLUHA|nr:cytoplasmic dynein 2 intermediate chain 1 isoform X3 [Clupea harengus]XP_042566210.1 cytoplasmic dynein 2 intermediate chain 1 isoform X4 [Clupea harengus]
MKITKEDTWRTDELKKHMRGYEEDIKRGEKMRRSEDERRHRSGASVDRRQRDHEREETRDKEKLKEREQKERTKHRELERYRDMDRRREDPREKANGRNEREREQRKDREKDKGVDINSRDKRHDRVEKETRDKEKEREKYKEVMSEREKERERDKRRAERERERRSERDMAGDVTRARLQDGEIETERDRRERNRSRDHMKESVHREGKERNRERERRERHGDHELSGYKEGREQREHRMEKEVGEKRRKEREHRGASEMRNSERERRHRDHGGSEGRIHGERDRDRERAREEPEKRHREESEQMKRGTTSSHKDKDNRKDRKDQMVVKSQSTWRSSQGDFNDPDIPVENEDTEKPPSGDYEEVDYEEDFEKMDYEEDFEDADEDEHASGEEKQDDKEDDLSPQRREEIRAIQRAMDEENERAGSSQSRPRTEESLTPRTDTETQPPRGRQHRGVIDFVSAKRREVSKKVSSRQKKRSAELLRMIDLDFSITFSVLDLPPVNEYDMYIKSFGTTNTKQAYVQCNEENTDREVQTEETDTSDKWTQHPAETSISCGGPDQSQDAVVDVTLRTNFDSRRLVSFLRSATQVMSVLLEEDRAERHALTRFKSQSDSLSFSDGCLQLNTRLPFLHGRQVSHLHFSDAQRQTLLSVHAPSTKPSAVRLDSQSIICVWNIWEPSRPQKTLVYESEVCCCCFSPGKATLVFAGTSVGSVVLWDLREPSSSHYSLKIGESDWILRYPTFSTDAVLSVSGHLSTVRAVEPVTVPVSEGLRPELPLLVNQEESLGLSFLLASLDEKGVLNLWVVVELPKSSDAGSQTDLGLRPGGKVKLLHSSTLQTCDSRSSPHDVTHPGPLQALLLKFLPSDSSHYFIGTNMGVVNHGTRHGLKAPPKFYSPQVAGFRPVQISSLEFCSNGQPHFLVGCGDGSVRLHSIQSEQPLLEWSGSTGGEAVVSVQWALTRPAVFCVLDAASCLHLWNLVEDQQRPVLTERIDVDSVTTMAVFGDPATQNMYSGIALAKHSGRIEIHYFRKRFTVPTLADSEKLDSLMRDAL